MPRCALGNELKRACPELSQGPVLSPWATGIPPPPLEPQEYHDCPPPTTNPCPSPSWGVSRYSHGSYRLKDLCSGNTRGLGPLAPCFPCPLRLFHEQHAWTTGVPDNGHEWRKFRVIPRSHHLCPCTLFTRGGNRRLLDYQGRAGIMSTVRWNLRPVIFGVDLC